MIRPGYLPSNYGTASVLGIAMALIVFFFVSKMLWELPLPFAMQSYGQHLKGWSTLRLHGMSPGLFPGTAAHYAHYLSNLPADVSPWKLTARFDVVAILALMVGAAVTWLIGKPHSDTRYISGRQLVEGEAAHRQLKKISKEECEFSGEGIKLHPSFDWCLSRDRESRHFFMMGSVGGGKTQIILPMIQAAIERGDKVIIYDNKGDFTSSMDVPFVLLAPWDARSSAWLIGADCQNGADARDLAARLIPEGNDPMWHQAARQILTAVILKLQTDKPGTWTWRDLHDEVIAPQDELLAVVLKYQPEARHLLEAEGKTTQGVLISFSASMSVVSDLAKAWGKFSPENNFSFSAWLHAKNPKKKVIVMQGSGRYEELTRGYVQGAVSLLSSRICSSSELGESKERRIWICFDEFPQLGKLDKFKSIIEVGRSKGVCCVLGAQDMAQIQDLYGQYVGRSFGSSIGTQIIVRVGSGDTADFLSHVVIGKAIIEKTIMHEGKPQPPQKEEPWVLESTEITDYLGADKHGVKAVIIGMKGAQIVTWPLTKPKKLREATVPAKWLDAPSGEIPSTPAPDFPEPPPPPFPPRIKFRTPTTAELSEMAETGSDLKHAGEGMDDMETGGEQ